MQVFRTGTMHLNSAGLAAGLATTGVQYFCLSCPLQVRRARGGHSSMLPFDTHGTASGGDSDSD